jgi:hypothetical protein
MDINLVKFYEEPYQAIEHEALALNKIIKYMKPFLHK